MAAMSMDELGPQPSGGAAGPDSGAVETLLQTSRVLVGIASRGLEQLGEEVTISQFRLLSVLGEYGPVASVGAAGWLGSAGSSVTRLADRLEESGHLRRRREPPNRSVVRLELTESGRALLDQVWGWRRDELTRLVGQLPPGAAETIESALRVFVEAAGNGYGAGPVELPLR
jgi:DNA-binding MarR family transcriptional regulator